MNNVNEFIWCEKYRPKTIDDCVLPAGLKQDLKNMVTKGELPNLLLCGTAGTGKTTAALAMCHEVGADVLFINASLENGIDVLRSKISQFASSVSLTDAKKVVILDEADYTNCIEETQEVLLSDGSTKPIGELQDGEQVMSFNMTNGVFELQPITVLSKTSKEVYEVTLEDGTSLLVTDDHPFIISDGNKLTESTIKSGLYGKSVVKMF